MKFLNNDYSFRGLGPTKADPEYLENAEYIDFAGFNSSDYDWWLIDRTATTPEEQEITESVPYMQGEYDFSMYDQERFFKTRELTYKFVYFGGSLSGSKSLRRGAQTAITATWVY